MWMEERRAMATTSTTTLPVHTDLVGSGEVLVYPTLQVQITAFVVTSWEQSALTSHPPLLILQSSAETNRALSWIMANLTCAGHLGGACVSITRIAGANNSVGGWMMGTDGISIASSILDHATVYRAGESKRSSAGHLPVQNAWQLQPVLVYPVLQVHSTALLVG